MKMDTNINEVTDTAMRLISVLKLNLLCLHFFYIQKIKCLFHAKANKPAISIRTKKQSFLPTMALVCKKKRVIAHKEINYHRM